MHTSLSRLAFVFLLLTVCIGAHPATAADATPADNQVSAAQARHVLGVLQDPKKRTELEETLGVIAKATQDSAPEPVQAAPAEPAADPAIALTQNGVVAQVFSRTERWFDSIGSELKLTARTMLEFRSVGIWWEKYFGTEEARNTALRAVAAVIAILAAGLAVEWLLRRLLRRPRELVAEHAARKFALEAAKRTAAQPVTTEAHDAADIASAADAPAAPDAAAGAATRPRYDRHWGVLRRIPYALAYAVLKWLPLLGFAGTSSLLIAVWGGPSSSFYGSILPLVGAYAATRITLCAIGVMVTPAGAGLRLAPITDQTARYLRNATRRIVVVAVFGSALTEVALDLGATPDARSALSKLVSLVVHIMLIVMVVQCRKPVADWIRGTGSKREGVTALRGLLADIWAPLAALFIVAFWIVWALGVANGFQQLLHYFALTAAVVLVAIVVAILALGALDKAFFGGQAHEDNPLASGAVQHYQRLTQRAVTTVVVAVAALALLEVWGVDALGWFRPGSIGRSIVSAASTIGVACILAIVAWETVNLSLSRRVDRWTSSGEIARATRLRTLVPILRTTLFIVIAMVVLFTALNELGINIAPLLAGASIIGVALGFGSQKLVQDFITGIFLLMENTMQVGDSVTVAGVSGSVEYLSIRTVRLRAGDGSLHVIPFSSVTTVTNTNRGIGNAAIRLSVRADSDLDAVIAAIKQVGEEMRADPKYQSLILADLDLWGVDQVDGATVTLAGQIRTTDRGRWAVQRGFNQLIWRRFRALGIQLSNPQETLMVTKPGLPDGGATPQWVAAPGGPAREV